MLAVAEKGWYQTQAFWEDGGLGQAQESYAGSLCVSKYAY